YCSPNHTAPPSFPTRRSSDLFFFLRFRKPEIHRLPNRENAIAIDGRSGTTSPKSNANTTGTASNTKISAGLLFFIVPTAKIPDGRNETIPKAQRTSEDIAY